MRQDTRNGDHRIDMDALRRARLVGQKRLEHQEVVHLDEQIAGVLIEAKEPAGT